MNEIVRKKERGITLIALVITIIVLLILAGVTIATLTGDNGILTKAQEASIQTRGAQVEEVINLWKSEIEMNENTNSNAIVKGQDELLQELLSDKQVYENEIDRENKTITIGNRVISYKTKSQPTDIYVALYNDGTLVFNSKNEFDTSKLAEGWTIENIKGKKYELINIDKEPWYDASKMPQWYGSSTVIKISFLDKVVPENIEYWFDSLTNLTTIENMNNLDTSNVTDMSGMFDGCSSLTSINLTGLDTSNVTMMNSMFSGCSGLTNIDVTNLDTSNVTDMSSMFYGCSGLTNIDVTNLDTSNVTDMSGMFCGCGGLMSIDLSNLDTGNVIDMSSMFRNCISLTNIDVSGFDVGKVKNMKYMFWNCKSAESINVSTWSNTNNVEYMNSMFSDCTKLTNIDVSKFNTSNVTEMGGMFSNCTSLTSINVENFDTSKVTTMIAMFSNCTGLTELDVSNFDVTYMISNPTRVQRMFKGVTAEITISDDWTERMKEESKYNG